MERKQSLAPLIYKDSKILILGSMPSEESLRRQEYYGFRANHFWRLTASVLKAEQPQDYEQKKIMLKNGKIALWDVIESCTREGSLDTRIRDEIPNSIPDLLNRNPGVKALFFNGQKAAASFKRSFGFELLEKKSIKHHVLPSSSPANTVGFEKKFVEWKIISDYLCT